MQRTRTLASPDRVFLNGRFLSQAVTGVQRYATEMIRALDHLIMAGDVPAELASTCWTLLTPAETERDLTLEGIETRRTGPRMNAQIWDQTVLPWAARNGALVSLANSGPILHRRHLAVIHDAIIFRHPEFYGTGYVAFHKAMGRMLARTASLGTVSQFSQSELAGIFGLPPASVPVFANGADHLADVAPDDSVIDELDLRDRPFFMTLGSMNGNKNVCLAMEAFAALDRPDVRLVAVGSGSAIFRSVDDKPIPGVIRPGRLSDEKIASLYAAATAFVFPSIYEGFGIPPLEAMAFGSPVLASTAGAVRETCGDAASYFEPDDAAGLTALMEACLAEGDIGPEKRLVQKQRAAGFSWDASARRLLAAIATL